MCNIGIFWDTYGNFWFPVLFDVSESHCKTNFIKVLKNWIIRPNIGNIDIESYLYDDAAMKRVAVGFSQRSGGVLKGAIGGRCYLSFMYGCGGSDGG